jgi:hypothetical protein
MISKISDYDRNQYDMLKISEDIIQEMAIMREKRYDNYKLLLDSSSYINSLLDQYIELCMKQVHVEHRRKLEQMKFNM